VANNPLFYDATVIAAVAAMGALLNGGTVQAWSGTQPALDGSLTGTELAAATFGSPAMGTPTASAGTVTGAFNAITSGTIANTGTAAYVALVASNGTTVVATGSCGVGTFDLAVNTTAFVAGATFAVSSGSFTQPQT
jgi:hypothetical protein